MFQKGYANGNLVYPLTNKVVLPVATMIFQFYGVAILYGALIVIGIFTFILKNRTSIEPIYNQEV